MAHTHPLPLWSLGRSGICTVLATKGGGSMGTIAAIAPKVLKKKGLAQHKHTLPIYM